MRAGQGVLPVSYGGYVGTHSKFLHRKRCAIRRSGRPVRRLPLSGRRSEDGAERLHFESLFPARWDGSDPDALPTGIRESGFTLDEGAEQGARRHTEAAFALAHRITGVLLPPKPSESPEFACALVTLP